MNSLLWVVFTHFRYFISVIMFDYARETARRSVDSYEPRQVDYFEAWTTSEVCFRVMNRGVLLEPYIIPISLEHQLTLSPPYRAIKTSVVVREF